MTPLCPTCGGTVEVVTADEGTSSFRPSRPHLLTDEMVERAAGALWDHRLIEHRRFVALRNTGLDESVRSPEPECWADLVSRGRYLVGRREVRAEARAALEAALGGEDGQHP